MPFTIFFENFFLSIYAATQQALGRKWLGRVIAEQRSDCGNPKASVWGFSNRHLARILHS